VVTKVLGDWQLSAIQSAETGVPITFTTNGRLPGSTTKRLPAGGASSEYGAWEDVQRYQAGLGPKGPCRFIVACALPWADINAFAIPPSYTPGQVGRNIINGPGMLWHQFALAKSIPITERIKGMLRVDFTAPFKYPFFNPPSSVVTSEIPKRSERSHPNKGDFPASAR